MVVLRTMLTAASVILCQGQHHWPRHGQGPVVDTESGPVEGTMRKAGKGETDVDGFFGIPYAAPPVGINRFRAPQPFADAWAPKIREAKRRGSTCPQIELTGGLFMGEEDCLFLNVYRPHGASNASALPVLVWIYGGGFFMGDSYNFLGNLGDGLYDGFNNVKLHEYVIVSMNYRLNGFGFMALPELAAEDPNGSTGNYGTMDQRAAMEWVQRNIRSFGGDPGRVTLVGESAGGISVSWHLASPASRGLFHAAIIQSGSARDHWFLQRKPEAFHFYDDWTATLGCESALADRLACLRKLPAKKLMVAISQWVKDWAARFAHLPLPKDIPDFAPELFPVAPFVPVIDGTDVGLPDLPQVLFDSGNFSKVPLIIGGNKDDGAYIGPILSLLWGAFPLTGFNLDKLTEWMLPEEADRVRAKELYGQDQQFKSGKDSFRRFFRDALFGCTTRDMSAAWSKAGVPVHTYTMSFDYNEWGILKSWKDAHALELVFTWRNGVKIWGSLRFDKKSYEAMADLMACTWASFVWCHAPKCPSAPKHCEQALNDMPDWPLFNISEKHYLSLKERPTVESVRAVAPYGEDEFPGEDRCDFWRTANMSMQSIRDKVSELHLTSAIAV